MEVTSTRDNSRVLLNVGGKKYETYKATLTQYPDTLLGAFFSLPSDDSSSYLDSPSDRTVLPPPDKDGAYFFDRNPLHFEIILEWYRTGVLVVPPTISYDVLYDELKFWGLDETLVGGFQWKLFLLGKECKRMEKILLKKEREGKEWSNKNEEEKETKPEAMEIDLKKHTETKKGEEDKKENATVVEELGEEPTQKTTCFGFVRKIIPLLQDGLRCKMVKKKIIVVKESQTSFELSTTELKNGDELIRDTADYNVLDDDEGREQVINILEGATFLSVRQSTNLRHNESGGPLGGSSGNDEEEDEKIIAFPTSIKKFETKFTSGPRNGEYTGEFYFEFKVVLDKEKIFQPPVTTPPAAEPAAKPDGDKQESSPTTN